VFFKRTFWKKVEVRMKIRVLYVIGHGGFGGIERHVQGILQNIDTTAVEPHLCVVMEGGPISDEIGRLGVSVTVINAHSGHDVRILSQFRDLLKKFKPDVIHAHEMQLLVLLTLMICQKIPVVYSIHCPVKQMDQSWWKSMWIISGMSYRIDRFVGVSQSTLDSLLTCVPKVKPRSLVVFNGLSMENLPKKDSFGLRQEFRIPDTAPLICGVGRLAEQKDWNSFLSVCAGIHNVLPICHFLAVGDGSLRDALKQRGSELGLDNNLHWLGARTDARRIIGGSDLFLFPSLHEELPTTLLEAFAMRTPVAGFLPTGGTAEVIALSKGKTVAMLLEKRDCTALTQVVLSILQNHDESVHMVDEAYKLVCNHFDMKIIAAQLVHVYQSLVYGANLKKD